MKKLLPLIGLVLVIAIAGLYGLDFYQKLRAQQREQVAYLLARCVNEGLLSLFTLQANDWRKNPALLEQEERRLRGAAQALPEKLLDGKVFGDWKGAAGVCERLTENTVRQHKTIFRPVAELAENDFWDLRNLNDRRRLERRKRDIDRVRVSTQAADRYLADLQADIKNLLQQSGMADETQRQASDSIEQQVFSRYHKGGFSTERVLQYLRRLEHLYQLLADNPRGYTLRAGTLYFYDGSLRSKVDNLNQALMQGEADFFNNWRQILQQ